MPAATALPTIALKTCFLRDRSVSVVRSYFFEGIVLMSNPDHAERMLRPVWPEATIAAAFRFAGTRDTHSQTLFEVLGRVRSWHARSPS
jgi:hypothetical protein